MKIRGLWAIGVLVLAVVALAPAIRSSPETQIVLEYPTISPPINPVTQFDINVAVYDVTNLHDWEVIVSWDPKIIRFVSVSEGSFLSDNAGPSGTEFTYNLHTLGHEIRIYGGIWDSGYSASGDGVLALLTFECYSTGDPFVIKATEHHLWQEGLVSISHTVVDADFYQTFPVTFFVRKVLTDVSGQRATDVDPAPGDTTRFDARYNTRTGKGCYAQPLLIGDVDRSGRVDVGDSGLVGTNWFKTEADPTLYWDADIDCSGRVDVGDSGLVGTNWFNTGGKIANFKWDFGDGTIVEGKDKSVVTHEYENYGIYTVNLTVTDGSGNSWSTTQTVKIWREVRPIDVWPCIDDFPPFGDLTVMPGMTPPQDVLPWNGTIFITGGYINEGTLKQNFTVAVYAFNSTHEILLAQRVLENEPPGSTPYWLLFGTGEPGVYSEWPGINVSEAGLVDSTYQLKIVVTTPQLDMDETNNEIVYSYSFTVLPKP